MEREKTSPYPEEINRQVVGIIAKFHFSPTEMSKENLVKEEKNPDSFYVTGNTAIDALPYQWDRSVSFEVYLREKCPNKPG